jgi:hypothetical protein
MKCVFCDTDMKVEQRHVDDITKVTLPGIAWCPSCLKWWHVTTSETPKPEKVVVP